MAIPSLAMIPSGYKSGKVYSVLPSNGDGDFTFSRGSNATRVNKDGLIEDSLELGSEVLADLDLTDWSTVGGASSVSSDEFTTTSTGGVRIDELLTVGEKYRAVISGTTTSTDTRVNNYAGSTIYNFWTSTGSFVFDFTFTASDEGIYLRHSSSGTTEVTSFSVKEVLSGEDTPRLDYTNGSCPSLLLEGQSTNLIPYSEDFSQSSWQKQSAGVASSPIVTPNYAISPDGTLNADRVVFDINGGTTSSSFSQITGSITSTIGDVTSSIWIKSNTTSNYNMSFVHPRGAPKSSIIVTTEWQRFDVTSTTTTTTSSLKLRLRGGEATSDFADVSLWGAQIEEDSYPTSYIPTRGEIATRLADVCVNTSAGSVINSSEGVLYAEMSALSNEDDTQYKTISLSDGTSANRVFIGFDLSNNIYANVAGENILSFNPTDATDYMKVALKYENNSSKLFVNGNQISTTNTTATMPSGLNRLGFDSGAGSSDFYGNVKEVRVYNEALTDEELEALTN